MFRVFSIVCFLTLALAVFAPYGAAAPRIIGYSMNPASPTVLEQSSRYITDLVYFSVEPTAEGDIDTRHINPAMDAAVTRLIEAHGVRVHLAVGGWGRSEHFAAISRNSESRAAFITKLIGFCKERGLSGVDYDWEFPSGKEEHENFAALLVESKAEFEQHELSLSTALSPWQRLPAAAYEALDRLHLMAYDNPGKHSTLPAAKKAIAHFIQQGVPAEKIFLGVPFYGRSLANREQSISYRAVDAKHHLDPDADEADGFYFNGPETIAAKAQLATDEMLGGVMIWELDGDTEGANSLLKALHTQLQSAP